MSAGGDDKIRLLADWLRATQRAVAFSGAGISTESGIPDFRSPGGLWSRHSPVMFEDFLSDAAERRRFWQIRREMIPAFLAAQPNAGHLALARLEAERRLLGVITQNIDELHQRAGSRTVLEIHGTAMHVHCLECDKRWPCAAIQMRLEAGEEEFICDECGGLLKSMTVSFGQAIPSAVMAASVELTKNGELFIALGSSLVVYPAASLPEIAKKYRARLVIINREPTPMDWKADLVIHGGIGETMSRLETALDTGHG